MLPSFEDNNGIKWTVDIDVDMTKKVRSQADYDLLDVSDANVARLAADPVLLVDVLYLICEAQATSREISAAQFGRALIGDPIDPASMALTEAILAFFPSRRRDLIKATMAKFEAADDQILDLMEQHLEGGGIDQQIKKSIDEVREHLATAAA